MLYNAFQKGSLRIPGFHDPNDVRIIGLVFTPDIWANDTVYYRQDSSNGDIVIPSTFTGVYYAVENPGLSGSTEPTWSPTVGDITEDGTHGLTWKAYAYNLMPPTQLISSVSYSATHSVTISNTSNNYTSCQFTIDALPAAAVAAGEFEVTIRAVKTNGEVFDTTLLFVVGER